MTTDPTSEFVTRPEPTVPGERQRSPHRGPALLVGLAVVAAILGLGIYSGVRARSAADATLKRTTAEGAVPVVSVVSPTASAATLEILLPGTTQAFTDAPIFARTNGYVKRWYFDIGAHVKPGQLLAEIETPEVDQQLQQAQADLATAQANLRQAQITADRWQALLESDSVSKQETDVAVSALSASKATVDSNAANVRRLEQLQGFQKIYAPFDGVITARNVDIGVLINAGSTSTSGRELFHMTAIHTLRVFVAVPEVYSRAARPGSTATLTLDEFPGQSFKGTLVRNANAIDLASRTLLVEVDVDNPTGELLPGAYVFVHLKLPKQIATVTVPANALLFRAEGLQVAVVRDGRAELVPVTIGRDYGTTVEISAGLRPIDQVIVAPSDSLTSGARVRIASAPGGTGP
ncbi:MAG: efflux transporter periplasmic adaptor subunit [Candidatus Rokuibacteriota bacterium]|nr:MAG: efflux transporter periplasmic adaptor subunit [Candidatus Rokubacteria bacterium]